ncbi:UDP-3-O-acyl-N-acetylglucosamine deacetylase [Psychrobacter sp. I-STPA10]|uniref:UDP-3-O-acyl-N-acetylglucosamine deacetylase n=1 Tax=Psychrobacter sp. I-STPA10 TaxID=2585769 RepID=UPI001E56F89C|nr:UDP-3-O-acyl-N-acetylglucosamine deacetylase [Psychrobacter sp. I-STPA10]
MKQRTIAAPVHISGVGLHSGKEVLLELFPSDSNTGIVFERSDLSDTPQIKADALLVQDTMMSSNLVQDGVRIGTVEHLLSAIAGLGIDNLLIRVSAAEIPIMDGSAAPFIELIRQAGIKWQAADKQFLQVLRAVRVTDADKWAELLPYDGYQLNFEIDFDHPAFDKRYQRASLEFSSEDFVANLSAARTFGFLHDIEKMRQHNLALGGSMENAIVIDDHKIMNMEGLRYADEFVRHKILDAVGDLSLCGYSLLAQFNAYKSGHALNNRLIRKLLSDKNNFEIVTFNDSKKAPVAYLEA